MGYAVACTAALVAGVLVSAAYITVFYHRAFAHGGISLRPGLRRFVVLTGPWVTGIDPKAWACMHRLHHRHSDESRDPHSPVNVGVPGVFLAQLRAYERMLSGLTLGKKSYTAVVSDLDFPISWANRHRLWFLPYVAQIVASVAIGWAFDAWLFAACLYLGLMSHPVQGWLVNSFGHAAGYRTFDTPDSSRNNLLVALFVVGEGLQNNHHYDPDSARFAYRWWEPDLGFLFCRLFQGLGLLTILKDRIALEAGPARPAVEHPGASPSA